MRNSHYGLTLVNLKLSILGFSFEIYFFKREFVTEGPVLKAVIAMLYSKVNILLSVNTMSISLMSDLTDVKLMLRAN